MQSILVPVEDHSTMNEVLGTAAAAARALDGTVAAVPLRPMQFQVVGAEPIVAVSFPPADQDDEDSKGKARALFDTFKSGAEAEISSKLTWQDTDPLDDIGLGSIARVHDLTVLGRPANDDSGARMTTLESVLFDSGRPVLIAPPTAAASTFGENIVMSWNCSTEGARTLAFAMPLLKAAKKVTVLTIEEVMVPGPTASQVCDNLKSNGIEASEVAASANSRRPGAAILEEAAAIGCDLLIKSAYTQSRLRQMIFGGATSHILSNAELPVFMAN
ncbi:MAG: universal stress protein [Pseudomonadota bacterium]